jgi:CDP-diacylglycerol--serine O-phosphatidyltransferase
MPQHAERKTRRARARAIVKARLEKLEEISVSKLVPSFLTLLGMCSGLTAIRFAIVGDWPLAVAAIVCAGIFDMLDGRAARMLGADSRFGAQLDSLADLVSFGVAPAVIMYMWSLSQIGDAGWAVALVFCAASAVRLARFNVEAARDEGATKANPYFTGMPTPAGACMALLPLIVWFQWPESENTIALLVRQPWVSIAILVVTSALMVSRLPTPSIKYMKLQRQHQILAGLFFAALGAALIAWPWATLTIGLLIYVASIPFAILVAHPRYVARNT